MHSYEPDIVGDRRVLHDLRHGRTYSASGRPRVRVLVVLGGGQSGILSAERFDVFARAGISIDHFDYVFCTSAGVFNAIGYAANQTGMIRPIYFAFCEFPLPFRMYYLISEIERVLDRKTFENAQAQILVGYSDAKGKLSLASAKGEPNLFGLLYAACAIPPFTFGIDPRGNRAYDGAFAHPCPIGRALLKISRECGSDRDIDILLLANRPRPTALPWYDPLIFWVGVNVLMRLWAPGLCAGANTIDAKVGAIIPMFEKRRARFRTCAWFPKPANYISPLEMNRFTLNHHADAIRHETEHFFEKAGW